jgi:hypothetical protein
VTSELLTDAAEPAQPAAFNPHHERRWLILAVLGLAQLMVMSLSRQRSSAI